MPRSRLRRSAMTSRDYQHLFSPPPQGQCSNMQPFEMTSVSPPGGASLWPLFFGQGIPAVPSQKIIMPDRSFRDVLLGDKGLEPKKLVDISNISGKAITLNVIPGSEVILEDIILDEDVKVNHPSSFKVPISDLHRKTVCLLFYEDNLECKKWTEELKKLYNERNDFEVVVVFSITFGHHPSHSVESGNWIRTFWKVFGDMPWLAIPFDDPKCRQLWRIFCRDSYTPKLLIIYSEGKYFMENGFEVLKKTGFRSYPFMRNERVQTSIAAAKEKNLSSFLRQEKLIRGRELDYALQEEFTVSKLFGVPVVLLFLGASGFSDFFAHLQYNQEVCMPTIERFEIVYILMMESPPGIVPDRMLVSPCERSI